MVTCKGVILGCALAVGAATASAQDLRTQLYDSQGRMIAVARAGSSNSDFVSYRFDDADNRLERHTSLVPSRVSPGELRTGETLLVGQMLISPNGRARLVFQFEGNIVLYVDGTARWSTPTITGDALRLIMQGDGNLVLYSPRNVPLWNSVTSTSNPVLVMQNDCNLVIYGAAGAAWATGTSC